MRYTMLGATAKTEMFGNENAIGKRIEISGSRFLVIGVVEPQDRVLGIDINDSVTIPTARALELFNREGLTGFHVTHDPDVEQDKVVAGIRRIRRFSRTRLRQLRHSGRVVRSSSLFWGLCSPLPSSAGEQISPDRGGSASAIRTIA